MPVTTTFPGVYIEEIPSGVRTITGVATSITAFVGRTPRGPVEEPTPVNSFGNFVVPPGRPDVGDVTVSTQGADSNALAAADYQGNQNDKTGIFALEKADLFNLLCIPPDTRGGDTANAVYSDAMSYCAARRAML